jgi:hypothetical protein
MARTPISMRVATTPFDTDWETVASSQTTQVLGTTGATGDILDRLIVVVATAATAQVQIRDGASGSDITVFPNSPGGGIGTYSVPLGMQSFAGGWRVTTGAGVSVIGVGLFT